MDISAPLPAVVREGPELGEVGVAAKDAERPRFQHHLDPADAILSISGSLALHFGPPMTFLIFTVWAAVFGAFCGVVPAAEPAAPPAKVEQRVAVKLVELREVVPEPVGVSTRETVAIGSVQGIALETLVVKKEKPKPKPKTAKLIGIKSRKREVAEFGIIGVLGSSSQNQLADVFADGGVEGGVVYGGLIGSSTGEAFGAGGLGLRGTGAGGGGTGIGIGGLGTAGIGTIARSNVERVELSVDGGLPRAVVDRLLSAARARMRACYRNAINRDATLEGRVAIAFVIDASGEASSIDTSGSSFADAEALACITRVFASTAFPTPEGGSAKVRAVFRLSP